MNKNILALMPVFIFMIGMLIVSIYVRRASAKRASEGFVKDYFIGSRSLGGFVLAMTTVATYSSVSSFVGGPGQAWSIGFGWIYMSVVQVTALLLVLGILGKKMAMVSRKIDAVTIIDVIRHRYQSDVLANISAIIIVIFFAATMVAQFVGGAKLFEAVTGYSYLSSYLHNRRRIPWCGNHRCHLCHGHACGHGNTNDWYHPSGWRLRDNYE